MTRGGNDSGLDWLWLIVTEHRLHVSDVNPVYNPISMVNPKNTWTLVSFRLLSEICWAVSRNETRQNCKHEELRAEPDTGIAEPYPHVFVLHGCSSASLVMSPSWEKETKILGYSWKEREKSCLSWDN